MKIEKVNTNEEILSQRNPISEYKDNEQSEFETLLNSNNIESFSLSAKNLNLISTDLLMEFDSLLISEEDAIFFNELVKSPNFALNINNSQLININDFSKNNEIQTYKTINVSKSLMNLISKAQETQKPMRLDFDNNVTIIMKIDKDGKLTAEFIPGDKAVEMYLRNNIPYLKQRFEEQSIAYNDLYYRQNNKQQQSQQNRNYKGESENE